MAPPSQAQIDDILRRLAAIEASSGRVSSVLAPLTGNGLPATPLGLQTPLAAALGGTGVAGYSQGDLLYALSSVQLARLAAGPVNTVLTSNGPGVAPSWQVVTGVSGGWQTLYSMDLTGQANQNLLTGGDGVKTIGGKPWTLNNSAHVTTARIDNGVGFTFTASDATGGTLSAKITDLYANANLLHDDIELWVRSIFTVPATAGAYPVVGFGDSNTFTNGANFDAITGPRYTAGLAWLSVFQINGNNNPSSLNNPYSNSLTDDVVVIRMHSAYSYSFFSGAWVGPNFPVFNTLRNRGNIIYPVQSTQLTGKEPVNVSDMVIGLAVGGAANAQQVATRIDLVVRQ
jgi:hypothetical protein